MLRSRSLIRIAALLVVAGCQEKLSAPAECPDLCPGGYDIREDTLFALPGQDSTYVGYAKAGAGTSLLVSHNFAVGEYRAAYKFARRNDSVGTKLYTFDSLALELTLGYRDTTVHGLKLYLYRLPRTIDSTTTFAEIDGAFGPGTIVDSFAIDDSVITKRLRVVYSGADTTKLSIPAADSGVLALGVQIRADQGTGVRIGSVGAGSSGPSFINYVTIQKPDTSTDTTVTHGLVTPGIGFNTYLGPADQVVDTTLLTMGGAPSARSLIRFPWPTILKDSATLIRATLQMIPPNPIQGLGEDTAFVTVRPVLADFGGKSPTVNDFSFSTTVAVLPGHSDTVSFEVRRQLTSWQGAKPVPPALHLMMGQDFASETNSFTRLILGSSRTTGAVPRIIVTYALKFPFGQP